MNKRLLLSLTLISLLSTASLMAEDALEEEFSAFEEESGFDDSDFENMDETSYMEETPEVQAEPSNLSIGGNLAFKTSYGYQEHSVKAQKNDTTGVDYSGFNQVQTAAYIQLDYRLNSNWKLRVSGDAFYDAIYDLRDENRYNQETLDTYRTQLRFDDTYIQGRLTNDIDLKVGRQIVVWGKSDTIRITDVINPLDNRLPGMTDIEDLRLSTTMAKLDYYFGSWNLSAMAIGETRTFIEAAPRSEFFPVDSVFPNAPDPFIDLEQPQISWDNMQYALAANGVFSGWDLSFYGADVLDSRWHMEGSIANRNAKRVVSKIQMLGSALNIAKGSWLLKSEVAFIDNLQYNSTKESKSRLDALFGFDYMGISDTVLSLELANKHIFNHETQMSGYRLGFIPDYTEEDEVQTAMRATHSFLNDSLNATALLSMFGHNWQYGGFARVSFEYDVMDAVVANFGLINYLTPAKPEEKPFLDAISKNDRLFADITYSF